jgi:hypothetical protein
MLLGQSWGHIAINYKVFCTKTLNLNIQPYSYIPEDSPTRILKSSVVVTLAVVVLDSRIGHKHDV